MDEASSKFVDQLAMEKIIQEKLAQVHHRPTKRPQVLTAPIFDTFSISLPAPKILPAPAPPGTHLALMSPLPYSHHPENHTVPLCRFPKTQAKGIVLFVHGLFDDHRDLFGFFSRELNRLGFEVYLTTLPFHHERTPEESFFSGEYFLSADLERTKHAFTQAVIEVRHCVDWLRNTRDLPVCVVGFSMGGAVALAAAGADEGIAPVVMINPAADLFTVIWTSPLCATIRADLIASGFRAADVRRIIASFDPLEMPRLHARADRQLLIFGCYDQITEVSQYETLIERWGIAQVIRYRAGHLNTLRVPRLATDVARFFTSDTDAEPMRMGGGAA